MIRKLLVANRSEIATRAFRAAYEEGIASVAVYTHDDRDSMHRVKADEDHEIGSPGQPLRPYLDADLLVETALRVGADAVYPGYGFLSENATFAEACATAGLTFVGPPAGVLAVVGDKQQAREAARTAGLPVLDASPTVDDPARAHELAQEIGFPLFVKASFGGGGRGMRFVRSPDELHDAVVSAMREAGAAFGDTSVYLERAVTRPRHIEVQVVADATGDVVHLFERDCSVQRRHQKVIELAPAPNLDPTLRDRLCADAVALARSVGYVNVGTVEFLVDTDRGEYAFIEMNPRIQVEHTVTEEITDVDIVRTQLRIAGGATLSDLGLIQERITPRGFALQCRITTEDPADGFRPDTGTISAYRAPGGTGVRIDEGSAYVGSEITPFFDPLLLKITTRGPDRHTAIARARRAVEEVRVRGVRTNQAFLAAVLDDPAFLAGDVRTSFIDDRPELAATDARADRASKLLQFLAEVTVNRPHGTAPPGGDPALKLPALSADRPPDGSKQRLDQLGPEGFAAWLRGQVAVQITDTTMRDAHQSLLATRVRSIDLERCAPHIAADLSQLLSLEVWGGATFDVALRFLHEDPWQRLARLRELVPNICLQMLLRGRNLLGYSPYPDAAVRAFVAEARGQGIDIFRIFDALNNVDPMRVAIDAVLEAGAVAEGALCYTGDAADPRERVYTLDYYLRVAEELVNAGVHVLAIKDMAGLLRAPAARQLVSALRARFDVPVVLHTHDTAGGQIATYLAAIEAGVDAVDGAAGPLAGMTSQPSLASIVAHTDQTDRATGLSLDAVLDLEPYWEAVRALYGPFDCGLRAPSGRVYRHEIPGGQVTNLRQQAAAMGFGDRFEAIEEAYERADRLLGGIVKVTPSSKAVGDLAIFAVSVGLDWEELAEHPERFDLPASVVGLLRGDLGEPACPLPEPFRTRALSRSPQAEVAAEPAELPASQGRQRREALSALLFPGPAADHAEAMGRYGDLSILPTRAFLYGFDDNREIVVDLAPGVRLVYALEAIGEPDENGIRRVVARVNGQLRPVDVRDASAAVSRRPVEVADVNDPGQIGAPVAGIVSFQVAEGDVVYEGQPVAIVEAMKMESTITAPIAGRVVRMPHRSGVRLEHGDLLMVIEARSDVGSSPRREESEQT